MEVLERARARRWSAVAVVPFAYALLCKVLLFRNLEYVGHDLYSFLEMSWSWLFTGSLLHENYYGHHAAIHNFYGLVLLSPLTLAFGAYGLFAAAALANAAAAVRVARSRSLELAARLSVLAGLSSPLAFFVFDDESWGFHPELLYPPLAVLLALDLREQRRARAFVWACGMLLVKEDGAIVCGSVLAAHFAARLWRLRGAAKEDRRRELTAALAAIGLAAAAFLAGLALLWALSRHVAAQETASGRLTRSLEILARTLAGQTSPDLAEALGTGLLAYALLAALVLLPLGRRFAAGLLLLAIAAPPTVGALGASAGFYKFVMMVWAPRLALVLALACACLVVAAGTETGASRPWRRGAAAWAALAALSWAGQLSVLRHFDYPMAERVNAWALWQGTGYASSTVPAAETLFARCVAQALPRGLPVRVPSETYPFFHRQSIVFAGREDHALRQPQVELLSASAAPAADSRLCRGPQVGELALLSECGLLKQLAHCGLQATGRAR